MKLKQIVVSIENAPGRLFEVTNALGSAGINLRALNLVDTGAFGQLRLLVSDVPKARRILMEMEKPLYIPGTRGGFLTRAMKTDWMMMKMVISMILLGGISIITIPACRGINILVRSQ